MTLQEAGEKIAKDELPVNHTGEKQNHVVVRICEQLSMDNRSMLLCSIVRDCIPMRGCWNKSSLLNMQETSEPEVVDVPQLVLLSCS